ncbi:MAG: zinc ABC transporter substrate-binding protein [Campylobacteraceae bacterium]|jgi:zinc transport system substrate-binding protein|nr:zinc ABC transporter substrate-binding protein [Campylobacteraceae bacterium]
MFRIIICICLGAFALYAKPTVTVSILPQQYMVEKIAGDSVDVAVMVSANANHETYEPKPSQMKLLAKSDIYFAVGLPFEEAWLYRFATASPKMKIIDTGEGIEKIELSEHHHDHDEDHHDKDVHHDDEHEDYDTEHNHHEVSHNDHDHASHGDHHHDGLDPHIWLDPVLVKIQAKTITTVLSSKYPQNAALYTKNYESFAKELDGLHAELSKKLGALKNRSFFVFHPSWGYFAKRYGLEQIFVEVEGKEPKAAELIEILKSAKVKNIKALLVEPQVSEKNAKIVADEIKVKLIKVDPMKKDLSKNLNELADTLLGL